MPEYVATQMNNSLTSQRIYRWAQLHPSGGPGWWPWFMESTQHRLIGVGSRSQADAWGWHGRTAMLKRATPWIERCRRAWAASGEPFDGVVTHFPPLAAVTGLVSRMRHRPMLIAHNFNLGHVPQGIERRLARLAVKHFNRFIVHSRGEIGVYSQAFDLPPERFEFVPLQRAKLTEADVEIPETPYVFAAGSAHRDYQTLMSACESTGLPTLIVAGHMHLDKLKSVPPNVQIRTRLSLEQCHRLVRLARIHVVPLVKARTAAGQVALVTGMTAGTPTIVSRSIGSIDYVEDGRTGFLVEPGDAQGLADCMSRLWIDAELRSRVGQGASEYAAKYLSDEAGAAGLVRVLDAVVQESGDL